MADREMTNEEAIEILGSIRACYNIFDEYDEPKYAALSKAIFALKAEPTKHYNTESYKMTVTDFPPVEYAPIKHGRWEGDGQCSACKEYPLARYMENPNYCPNCGARMDEVEE